ncbi:hypothetical protein [Aliivibrio sifiae]|uniref:Uncharacterized protein n=1 Tax=Aliivibrio sifiae TaxID=566293 RepID=A0ABQ6ACG6_9GAMM|nr:hypothetical protein [Aliivibrio sifiae]GLR74154.1 hypothetical protein GCM10007855_10280 [Aliivibrio sifiae]
MMNRLTFFLLILCFPFFASADNIHSTLSFKKQIKERCGLVVIEDSGGLNFGRDYDQQAITLKLISNRKNARLLLRLSRFDLGDLSDEIQNNNVYFRLETPNYYEGNVDYWTQGVEISAPRSKDVYIKARINKPELLLPAGDIRLNMEWSLECL